MARPAARSPPALLAGAALLFVFACTAPRSRNVVAAEDGEWYVPPGGDPMIPAPENCPHCLNRGSATFGKGVCGITQVEKTIYDAPLSWQGQPLPFQPQAHYAGWR